MATMRVGQKRYRENGGTRWIEPVRVGAAIAPPSRRRLPCGPCQYRVRSPSEQLSCYHLCDLLYSAGMFIVELRQTSKVLP
jgi:hypothetical protein